MKNIQSFFVCVCLIFVFCICSAGDIMFINRTKNTIRIKVSDATDKPFRIDLTDKEVFVLEKARQFYKIAFSKVMIGELQKIWIGTQYDNNSIPVRREDDLLIYINSSGEGEGNYFQVALSKEGASKYITPAKGMHKIKNDINKLWSEIVKVKTKEQSGVLQKFSKSLMKKKILYFFKNKGQENVVQWYKKILFWKEKIEDLRGAFSSETSKYKISGLNQDVYNKVTHLCVIKKVLDTYNKKELTRKIVHEELDSESFKKVKKKHSKDIIEKDDFEYIDSD